jgi:hypothetical protein
MERKTREVMAAIDPLKKEVAKIEAPYRKAQFEAGLKRLPEDVQAAIRIPVEQRTAGQKLLAAQFERNTTGGRRSEFHGRRPRTFSGDNCRAASAESWW